MTALDPSPGLKTTGTPISGTPISDPAADKVARRIAGFANLSGFLWLALGAFQIVTIYLAIAGIWNFFAGLSRLRAAERIHRRQANAPSSVPTLLGLILICVVNVAFGMWWGVAIVAIDLVVRRLVRGNSAIFTR